MLYVYQGKGSKDRCIPLGKMLCWGIPLYLSAAHPWQYLFEGNGRIVSCLLFQTAWSVINGYDPNWLGARTGMIAILHTWEQTLQLHPCLCLWQAGACSAIKQGCHY